MGNKNFIVINGKKYDAITGKMLDASNIPTNTQITSVNTQSNGGVVDGFVRRPQNKQITRTAAQSAGKQTQKSQTLMRNSVNKPTAVVEKVQAEKAVIHRSHLGSSIKRSQVAMQTPQSQHIQKYGQPVHRTSVVKTANPGMSVKQEPTNQHQEKQHIQQDSTAHVTPRSNSTASQKIISTALANANSHNEPAPTHHVRKKRNRLIKKLGISVKAATMSSAVLAFVLLSGFFAIQNVPNLSMRVAAARAGFDATMPSYQPSGFSFKGPINYKPGQVIVSFKSNTDNRAYQVKEQASKWNSDALLNNFVIAEGKQYQTYLDKGRTLYIYDGSNATWVDNGVWYQIEGESSMTTDQLIRIASSI